MVSIDILVCRLQRDPAFLALAQALLDPQERQRADRFRFDQHRDAFIAARGILRTVLGEYTGRDPASLRFTYSQHGKPSLPGNPIHFNVSHSGELAVYALCEQLEVGVDVERVRHLNDLEPVARRFFDPAEFAELMAVPEEDRPRAFFNCWTRKEAFIKALGSGLSYPLNHFQVTLAPSTPARFVHIEGQPAETLRWSLHDIPVDHGYVAALAVQHPECRLNVQTFGPALP